MRIDPRGRLPIVVVSAAATVGFAQLVEADEKSTIRPDATMMRFPDVSSDYIVFVYANDIWRVPREGGMAVKLASPPGEEQFPRFSPDGSTIAFEGNYEGARDLYTLPVDGAGTAYRVTHHPTGETLCDWTPDGKLLFSDNHESGRGLASLFTVSAEGGLPEALPVPYGSRGAISDDGAWLAYTPFSRDGRTWKRYRGGMASDIWLLNLTDHTSRRVTDWEGTDSLPMWHGDRIYYLSDAGPNHKLNIWYYDTDTAQRRQVTHFDRYDVKWPSIGPGKNGKGEIVLQNGSQIHLLDLATTRIKPVEITIPGDRPTLRKQDVDYSDYIQNGDVSATGKRGVVEARGEIWSLPAEKGITRNLTQTDGAAERNPIWSPDGRWIAYLSDATGEYEIYITQSDGKGETKQLTDNGETYRYLLSWSPDSKYICFTNNAGEYSLVDVETQQQTHFATDPWAEVKPVNWSHDSKWLTLSLAHDENQYNVVHVYNLESGELTPVTSPMFNSTFPAFDRKGKYLFFASTRHFSPTYASVPSDTSWVYRDGEVLLAVPLNDEVENPWKLEVDEEEWEEEEADTNEDAEDSDEADDAEEGDKADGEDADEADEMSGDEGESDKVDDEDGSDDEDAEDGADAFVPTSPLHGVWEGNVSGLSSMGLPAEMDSAPYKMTIVEHEDGTFSGTGTVEIMGQSQSDDLGEITFNEETGELVITDEEQGIESTMRGKLDGNTITGTWEMPSMGAKGEFTVTKTEEEAEVEDDEEAKPVEIDFEGFEARAMQLPVDPGNFALLSVNDKNQLLYMRMGDGMPSLKLFDIEEDDAAEKNVLTGVAYYRLSGDGKKVGAFGQSGMAIVSAASGQSFAKPIPTDMMRGRIDPRQEWRQIFNDAWRIQRDFFYVENMHGVDWDEVRQRYGGMIDDCVTRRDLSFLIEEMIGELNVGHAYYFGGDVEGEPRNENVGLLGCDFALVETDEGAAFQFKKIYQGAPWDSDARNPLRAQGIDVSEGQYLLEVNGRALDTDLDPWVAFIGLAGQVTELTVSDKPVVDDDARRVLIKPMGGDGQLRYRDWIEANRKYVEEQTDGRIGYIYVPDTGTRGQTDLVRQFFGQRHLDGLIIDERWNGGGQIPTRFIELLNRPATNMWAARHGGEQLWPPDSHQGPKVMLINGLAGSGGDMFPALFKQAGLGPLIGTRTWGGLVGISGNPGLIDRAFMSVPTFGYYDLDGTWGIEGHGVDPDIEVIDDPALMVDGGDPQLDRAIEEILKLASEKTFVFPQRPADPDRSGMGITEEDK